MTPFNTLKCPSCGSSTIENKNQLTAKCSYCGSSLSLKTNKFSQLVALGGHIRVLLIFIVIILSLLLITKSAWLPTKDSLKPVNEKIEPNTTLSTKPIAADSLIKPTKEQPIKPNISILSKVKGHTTVGGIFWIVKIRNDSDYTVARPGVVMSLFDDNNKRIDEQRAWSAHTHLTTGQESQVMILIANPPKINYRSQMVGIATTPSKFAIYQEPIEVIDFVINKNDGILKDTVIVGDVFNPHEYQVNFVKIMALAYDANGVLVGMANSYATTSSIPAKGRSGFKIRTNTFIAKPPTSWSLWAIGSKHRKN